MADVRGSTGHDSHDLELIAGLAAGDLTGSEATRAGQLAASCADCARIMSDLRAIATATRTMPSAFDPGTAPAPRDYRLTAADATRLERRSWFGLGGNAGSRTWMRRAGVSLATFGLVGLLVSAVPLGFPGAGGAAASLGGDQSYTAASAAPQAQGPESTAAIGKASGDPGRDLATSESTASEPGPEVDTVAIVGAGALVVGLALILASRRARRTGA